MNEAKREILNSVVEIIKTIRHEENLDLVSTPDNIEGSEHCDNFRENIFLMDEALDLLEKIR